MRVYSRAGVVLALLVAGLAAGCTQLQQDWTAVEAGFQKLQSVTVSPTAVNVAVNLFDGVEATATNYLTLPKCNGANGPGPACRNATATAQIIPAIKAGRVARNNLEQFLAGHQTALGVQGDYDAINAVVGTLQAILAQYPTSK